VRASLLRSEIGPRATALTLGKSVMSKERCSYPLDCLEIDNWSVYFQKFWASVQSRFVASSAGASFLG
jgi:hypothetical protein